MLSERAFQKLSNRKTKVASYYLDATLFGDYWGWYDKRFYHHTGAVSTWCEPRLVSPRPLPAAYACSLRSWPFVSEDLHTFHESQASQLDSIFKQHTAPGCWAGSGSFRGLLATFTSCKSKHAVWFECRYGIREALAITSAEGLESLWARHKRIHEVRIAGLRPASGPSMS